MISSPTRRIQRIGQHPSTVPGSGRMVPCRTSWTSPSMILSHSRPHEFAGYILRCLHRSHPPARTTTTSPPTPATTPLAVRVPHHPLSTINKPQLNCSIRYSLMACHRSSIDPAAAAGSRRLQFDLYTSCACPPGVPRHTPEATHDRLIACGAPSDVSTARRTLLHRSRLIHVLLRWVR